MKTTVEDKCAHIKSSVLILTFALFRSYVPFQIRSVPKFCIIWPNKRSFISFYSWWILGHPITMGMRINQNSCALSRRNCAAHPVASVLSPAGNSRLEQSLKSRNFNDLCSKLSFQLSNGKCVKTCSLMFPIMSNLVLEMFISKPFLPFKNIISGRIKRVKTLFIRRDGAELHFDTYFLS